MHALQFLSEAQPDPIWLRTLATVLPVVGTIIVATVAAPSVVEKLKQRNAPPQPSPEPTPTLPNGAPGIPPSVTISATEKAAADPIIRLFIEDLHERLSMAHNEAANLHTLRAADAATIARLTAELAEKESRLGEIEQELNSAQDQNREFRARLRALKEELEATQLKLELCVEGYNQ